MAKFYIIGFLILLTFDTLAQVSFKFAATNTAPATLDFLWILSVLKEKWAYMSLVGYIGAFVTWMTLLKHAPVGPAFAASHLEIVTVMLFSFFFLGEHLSPLQIFGSLLIIGGIIVFAMAEADLNTEESASDKDGSIKEKEVRETVTIGQESK